MKQDWHADELAHYWMLSPDERELLGNKTGAARLSFAVLLKAFQFDGRFPDRREDVASSVVVHLASQTGVLSQAYFDGEWSGRTMARTGLRMMPTFPSSPLRFRTAGFPQYGSKAGLSDGACPCGAAIASLSLRPSFVSSAA